MGRQESTDLDDRRAAGAVPAGGAEEAELASEEPAGAAPPASGAGRSGIGRTDRVAAIGMTGSGKSQLLIAGVFAVYGGQRLLIDVNDDYELGPDALAEEHGGGCVATRVSEIDWRKRTIHFIPRSQTENAYNDLYAAIWDRAVNTGSICVLLDESWGPTTPNKAPAYLRRAITQGRKKGILHLAAMQEPVNVLPVLYSQANHCMLFKSAYRPGELTVLRRFGMKEADLLAELDRLPQHGYLRHTLGDQTVYRMPPLPPELVERAQRVVYVP